MKREELVNYLGGLLQPERFRDYCPNGLQVEGRPEIVRLVAGVTASQALLEAGLAEEQARVYYGHFTVESGYELAGQALAAQPAATALFASNNFLAIGALKALRDAGRQVPEDISLVGFDDLPPALVIDPFLTVAAQPAYEMGHRATRLLLARLAGQAPPEFQDIVLPIEVIARRSTGPAHD